MGGRLFGGLVQDVRRKASWYPSDFLDALHPQCFSAVLYIYLATITNAITFGGLPFRLWVGIWVAIFCLVLVATEASVLVRYFTRFTEEGFCALISLIFIYDASSQQQTSFLWF